MKKHLLSLLIAVMAVSLSLQAQTILINDGFENGIDESIWTQEFVRGNTPWAVEGVEDGLLYPETAFQGTKRAYLRNTTGETQGYVTRLVTKVLDLSPRKVYQPELTFWYANPKWTMDRDTLRVLYRTSQNGKWKQMAEYSSGVSIWTKVNMALPEVGSYYQIAFEGTDNLGRGIVLDSVLLRSAPECTVPHDLNANNKGANKVNLSWVASWDAQYFEVVVSKDTIDPDTLDLVDADRIAYHELIDGMQMNCDITLEADQSYLAYVRSICRKETSIWSSQAPDREGNPYGPFGIHVRPTVQVPYFTDFELSAALKSSQRDPDWSYGSRTGNKNPYINSTTTSATTRGYYSLDKTYSLIFSGGESTKAAGLTTPIPAGTYVYATTPALADTTNPNFHLNQCQIHFWSTVYTNTGRNYARSLMVGVMTDPDDITTFTAVDTVSVWGNKTFQENIVDLSSYRGNGAYVALVSYFDRQNLFYIDNFSIDYRPAVNKVTKVSVNPRDTYANISWEGNASSYEVLITNAEVDPENPAEEAVVDRATVNTNSYLCEALEADHSWNRPYYVYVKAGDADWSYRYPFVTIQSMREVPYSFDFEKVSGTYKIGTASTLYIKGIGMFSNASTYPYLGTTNYYLGAGCLMMNKPAGTDVWVTLPMVEKLDSVQVKFQLSGATTFNQSHAKVGVMTNPMDINTFVPVADFKLNTSGYSLCYANFKNYSGSDDGVIAIVWDDVMNMSKNTINYIDQLVVEELSDCVPPTNILLDVESDAVTTTWDPSDANTWEVAISRTALTAAQKEMPFASISALSQVIIADTVSWNDDEAPVFRFEDLVSQTRYFFYVRTICDGSQAWWTEIPFETPCPNFEFPYKETFENYNVEATEFGCWKTKDFLGIDYPKIYSGSNSPEGKSLELYSSGTTHRSVVIMPTVEGNLSDMLLCFDTRSYSSYSASILYVGTMGDINDANSFIPFDTIRNASNGSVKKVRLKLEDYNLVYDNIAFSSGLGNLAMSSDVMVDNIELKDPSCIEPYDFVLIDSQEDAFDITWKGESITNQWEIQIYTTDAAISNNHIGSHAASAVVIPDTIITGDTLHIGGLQPVTTYYVYVRALCGDSLWTKTSVATTCQSMDPSRPNKETFESYSSGTSYSSSYQADCWTTGNAVRYPDSDYKPFVYRSASYATSGTNSYRLYADYEYDWWSGSYSDELSGPAYLATPRIKSDSLTDLTVTFSAAAVTSNDITSNYVIFGVMTNPNDISTFVALDSIPCSSTPSICMVDLSEKAALIPAKAYYVAWRTPYDEAAKIYIDDVSITRLNCPLGKPSISEVTENSVRISSGIRVDDTNWVLLVTTSYISPDDLQQEGYVIPADKIVYLDTLSSRSQRVTGLSSQTNYYVAMASICDSVASLWSTLAFRTLCAALTPEEMGIVTFSAEEGYTVGEGRELPCWMVGSKTAAAADSYIPYVDNTSPHSGYNYLQFHDEVTSSSYSSTNVVGAYAIMPELNVDLINRYQVSFYGRGFSTYNSQLIIGVVTDPSDITTFVAVDTVTMNPASWERFDVGFESYQGDYMGDLGRNIMFLSDFGVTNYACVSEISVDTIPACRPIASFEVDSVGEAKAIVSWKGYQDSYRLLVADKELRDSEKATYHYLIDSVVNHSNRVLVENLAPATSYYIYAQGICGDGDSTAVSGRYAFVRTECPSEGGLPLPFSDDFETYNNDERSPGCWIFSNDGSSSWPKVETVSTNGSKAVDLYTTSSGHSLAVLPKLNGNLIDLQLSFDARTWSTTGSGTIYIGTIADPLDPTTFETIESFPLTASSSFSHYVMTLADYNLTHDYLAFTSGLASMSLSSSSTSDVYLDNVSLEILSTCHAPKMKSLGATFNAIDIELIPNNVAHNEWDVVIIPDSVYARFSNINIYLDTTTNVLTTSERNIHFADLQSATTYCIFARTKCGGDEGNSAWSKEPLRVHTAFYFRDSYFFGFEKKGELWERSKNSASDNYYIHPALTTGRDSLSDATSGYAYYPYSIESTSSISYAHTDKGALNMYGANSYFGGYVMFPAIDEASDRSFELKIRPGYVTSVNSKPAASYDGVVEIGVADKNRDFENYEPIATIRMKALDPNAIASEQNDYLFSSYTLDLPQSTMADKQIVLRLPKQSSSTVSMYIDNVSLSESKGYSLVSIRSVEPTGEDATIVWDEIGGPWDLVITTVRNNVEEVVHEYTNLTTTSIVVDGLEPQTDYVATLKAASAPKGTAYTFSTSYAFSTTCRTLEPDENGAFYWSFDEPEGWEPNDVLAGSASDTAYLKPSCFNVGITYQNPSNGYQWLIQRKGYDYYSTLVNYSADRHLEVGRNDSHSLRVNTTSSYFNSYIVLPQMHCSYDTMMIEFYGRCFANYDDTYSTVSSRGAIVGASYLGSSYSQSMVVGTVDNPYDLSTLQVIDTLTYRHTSLTSSDKVTSDPDGLKYWELMQLPLTEAQGKYIVLFQPAYGLFFIDDLSIKPIGNTVFPATGAHTESVSNNDATLAWRVRQPEYESVIVVLNAENEEIFRDTILGTGYHLTNLSPATNYSWYVYQTNGGIDSQATPIVTFNTDCAVVSTSYATGFELAEGWKPVEGQTSNTVRQTLCWTYGDALRGAWTSSSYDPFNQPNSDSYIYAKTDSFALFMRASYSSYSTSYQPYAALPEMDPATYDTLQISFWMRPAYARRTNGNISTAYTGSTYSKSIIVGSMTDPNNAATFVPIDTVTYEGTLTTSDVANEANHFLFQQKKLDLAGAKGRYIALMTSFGEKGAPDSKSGDYIWIDDVAILRAQDCKDPKNLVVEEVTATSATLSWDDGGLTSDYRLQVSTDPYFVDDEAIIFDREIHSNPYVITGLAPMSTYAWRVQNLCGDKGESAFSSASSFTTSRMPFFVDRFETSSLEGDWITSTTHADVVVDADAPVTPGNNSSGFRRITGSYGINSPHYVAPGYANDYHWFITPNLYLPEEDSVHLSFDLALTALNSSRAITANAVSDADMKDDYYFMVIVSEDGGQTWKSENILSKWQNTNEEGRQLRDIPATATTLRYSLAQYAGRNIRIGFYREAVSSSNTGIAIHLDNVRVAFFNKEVESATACQYEDVQIGDIYLSGDETLPGIHSYPTPVYVSDEAAMAGTHDPVFAIEVEVFPVSELVLDESICEGESYNGYGFQDRNQPGTYRRKLVSEHSCDSVITLNLSVIPRLYGEDTEVAICPGEPFIWHDKEYNRAGIYRDTLVSSLGCDSIETLVVSYVEAEETIYDEVTINSSELPYTYQNPAHPYSDIQTPLTYPVGTPAGVHIDTAYVKGNQCSAMLILTLTINNDQGIEALDGEKGLPRKIIFRDQMYIILNDEWYTPAGQKVTDPRL